MEIPYSQRIRTRRQGEGIQQGELAKEMGIAQSTLCQYETGRRSTSDARLHEAFAAIERIIANRQRSTRKLRQDALAAAR